MNRPSHIHHVSAPFPDTAECTVPARPLQARVDGIHPGPDIEAAR